MKKSITLTFNGVLLFLVMCLINTLPVFAEMANSDVSKYSITMDVNVESFESSRNYAKNMFEENSAIFNDVKDWVLSEKCQPFYKTGPYPEEVRKSLFWTESRRSWDEKADLYKSESVYENFDLLFSKFNVCTVTALNEKREINLYSNPAVIVSFGILDEQYECEDVSAPPSVGYEEKSVIISYDGKETFEVNGYENDYIETIGDGWHLIMSGYDTESSGDCNDDGTFNVSDIVLLQKWLLNVPDTHLANWKAADLCEDGVINVFDLCVMKRKMFEQNLKTVEDNEKMNDSINITSVNSISNDFKSKLSEAIINTNPDFDFSDFTFESRVWSNIADKNHKFIGERHVLWVYYKNILLNPDKYAIEVYDYYDSNVKMEDDIFKSEILANADKLNIGNYISEKEAAQIAEKYSDGLEIPAEKSHGYELGKFKSEGVFDDNIELMIYSLETPQIVYKVSGSNYDYDFIDDVKKGYVVLSTDINVYIDAQTGKVIDHDFEVIMGIS